ncbi:MAG: hypothetical protein ABIY51_01755 [Ferruginibacter sp.]
MAYSFPFAGTIFDYAGRSTERSKHCPLTGDAAYPGTKRHMKNQLLLLSIITLCLLGNARAQEMVRQKPCNDISILHQADSIKALLTQQGFIVVKENSMTMESEYEMPIIVPLTQGSWYQFVFIGDITSRLYEVRMFDWNERQVVYQKKMWGDVDGNIISYNYIPKFSEYHMIKPVQVNKKKKKDLCGYVMLLKKVK